MRSVLEQLDRYIAESRCYLDPDLTLGALAAMSGVPRHHISQALNGLRGMKFYFYINSYRIEAFEDVIRRNCFPGLSMVGVAMECGFKSSSSFYNAVRRIREMTPGELVERISNEGC